MTTATTDSQDGTNQPDDAAAAEAAAKATADKAAADAAAKAAADKAASDAAATAAAAAEAASKLDYTGLALKDDSPLDKEVISRVTEAGKAMNLPKEHAEKLLSFAEAEVVRVIESRQGEFAKIVTEKWPAEVKADAELGGAKYDVTVQNAERAITRFATPEFKKTLNDTGWGAHPELVRVFARIGAAMREDKFESQHGSGPADQKDLATRIYGGPKAS